MKQEPAVTVASITAGFTAIIALLVAFGIPLTDEQTAAILGVVAVIAPLVVGFVTRPQVTPNDNVAAKIDKSTGNTVAAHAAPERDGTIVAVVPDTPPAHGVVSGDD